MPAPMNDNPEVCLPARPRRSRPGAGGRRVECGTAEMLERRSLLSAGELNFDAPSYEVDERAGTLTVTVTRSGGADGSVRVNWSTFGLLATPGEDYQPAGGTVELLDGETS